jgi:HEAT repeats
LGTLGEFLDFLLSGAADRRQAWMDAAASCGLKMTEIPGRSALKAWAGRLEVRIEFFRDQQERSRIVVVIPGPADFLAVRIRSKLLAREAAIGDASFDVTFSRQEAAIGDVSFDSSFSLEGPRRQMLALLDAKTRRLLLRLDTRYRLEISTGSLRAEAYDGEAPKILPLLLDLGRRLAQSNDAEIPQRLAKNAQRDPEAGVRLQNLLLLTRELPEHPVTIEALRIACSDPSPAIQLRAAEALGAEGRDVLLKLAESMEDDAVSAQAVSILDRELPFERMTAILDCALRGHRIRTACACLEALGLSEDAAAVEPVLIPALQHESKEVQTAAANALGRGGSAAAVLPLKEAAERSLLDRDLRRAARQAIAEIQSRLAGASPGQLSLAGTETGQLSLAADQAGHLSLPSEEAGQLSLSQDEEETKPAPGGAA